MAHFVCTFLCRCFARLQRETSRNFLVTRFMGEMSYVFLITFFFSLPLIFTLVAASISYFLTAATKFLCCCSCCSSHKKCLLFIPSSSSLSLLFSLSFAGVKLHLGGHTSCLSNFTLDGQITTISQVWGYAGSRSLKRPSPA